MTDEQKAALRAHMESEGIIMTCTHTDTFTCPECTFDGKGISLANRRRLSAIPYKFGKRTVSPMDLRDLFEGYVDGLQDSEEHKCLLLSKDKCFVEWVEEHYPERLFELD